MIGEEKDASQQFSGSRKMYWRSASWSVRTLDDGKSQAGLPAVENSGAGFRGFPVVPPLTPRSQQNWKARSALPPLQPLSISRRSVDEWPKAGSDDLGEWHHPLTPGAKRVALKPVEMEVDLDSISGIPKPREFQLKRDKIAFFDKECSRIAEHVYLGSDAVAKNREILRQNGITHVLNCVGFVCPEYFKKDLIYKTLWLQDSPSEDITSILYDVFDYFEEVRENGGRVLVHCYQGVSRSTSLVIAYLMWRDGQSFEDAFQYVKAARGITNPNMGFAGQLLQCQKRVHAAPVSPSSVLRMYRVAPHSPYDPLHLVPKMLSHPGALALDSRGAFLVHVPSAIYVWAGKACVDVMAKDARAAACQVVRYERVQGPIVTVEEGAEPLEFWDALSSGPLFVDDLDKVGKLEERGFVEGWFSGKDQVASAIKLGVGNKKVESYDVDFEIFHRALTGGVVPPFPLSGAGSETHLPARENGWSRLRRKFVCGSIKEFVTASRKTNNKIHCEDMENTDMDASKDDELNLFSDPLLLPSPPYPSPGSLSIDSNTSLKNSLKSSSPSPSDSSSSSTLSPVSSNWSESSFLSSQSSPPVSRFFEPFASNNPSQPTSKRTASLPPKGSSLSLAQRRGGVSPSLQLLPVVDHPSQVSKNMVRSWSVSLPASETHMLIDSGCHEFESESFDESNREHASSDAEFLVEYEDMEVGLTHQKESGYLVDRNEIVGLSSKTHVTSPLFEGGESFMSIEKIPNLINPILFRWPTIEKVETFGSCVLDSTSVFLLLVPAMKPVEQILKILYLWVGSDAGLHNSQSHLVRSSGTTEGGDIYWKKIADNFLVQMKLPKDIPVQIVWEAKEPDEFLNHLNSYSSEQAKEARTG